MRRNPGLATVVCLGLLAVASPLCAQDAVRSAISGTRLTSAETSSAAYRSPAELKKLSLEQLVDVQISSASRRPEPISQAASAIDVITGDTIRRSGVTNLPDALRLGAGMEVAQIDSHTWAISARGFNSIAANKLQVLMDGRSLYTPLFSGVFWDVQRTFLPDLEQIEVIRGPGATLWGANAVNGVINIRTKNAAETQGILLDAAGGTEDGYGGVRYGGRIGRDTYYRAYVMREHHDGLTIEGGGDAHDETDFTQGGFRLDSTFGSDDTFTLQGDGYAGSFGQLGASDVEVDGGNIIARWTRQLGNDASFAVQTYYDRTHRLIPPIFEENRDTFDLEMEGRFVVGAHDVVYGGNYRLSADRIGNLGPSLAFIPAKATEQLASVYLQDEWRLVPRRFAIAIGSKFEYNTFSQFEIQPSGRFVWTPGGEQTIWGAISRAVRTPDADRSGFVCAESEHRPASVSARVARFRFGSVDGLRAGLSGATDDGGLARSRALLQRLRQPAQHRDSERRRPDRVREFTRRRNLRGDSGWSLAGNGLVGGGRERERLALKSAAQPRQQ